MPDRRIEWRLQGMRTCEDQSLRILAVRVERGRRLPACALGRFAKHCGGDKRERQQAGWSANADIDCAFCDAFGIMRVGV
jgi:hypothetical protein